LKKKNVEILYLAWNRQRYTALTWHMMIANTDWDLVRQVTVYDDGSEDGTLEFLRAHIGECPVRAELRETDLRSPPAAMNHFLAEKRTEFFAKIDNDILLPPLWLNRMHDVLSGNPNLELLGMEAGQTRMPSDDGDEYGYERANHIGGVGLFRTVAFTKRAPLPYRGRYGFGDWQYRYNLNRGWIMPDLMVPQLDRVPTGDWPETAQDYIEKGWQRDWGRYSPVSHEYWDWCVECR